MSKLARFIFSVAMLSQIVAGQEPPKSEKQQERLSNVAAEEHIEAPATLPQFSPNRLIVKFRSGGENQLSPKTYRLLNRVEVPQLEAAELAKVKPLVDLSRSCGLKKMRHLFFPGEAVDPATALDVQRQYVEKLQTKFPKRSRRAPGGELPDLSGYFLLEFDGAQDIQKVRRQYEESSFVESAHFDPIAQTRQEPNDPFLQSRGSWGQNEDDLWGLKCIGCPQAWETSKGRGIVVAVIDTGLEFEHPDIIGNVWFNGGEVPANQKDDDGNGFVDDVRGWDFVNDDNDPLDDNSSGHGTHVAGTIAAVGNNGVGVIGVAPEAKVMAVKGIGAGGSVEFSVAAAAFFYAVNNGADVINCSWGPGPSFIIPSAIEDLVRFANGLGVVVVFAAGNDSRVAAQQSPMNMKEVLTVGASVPDDARMSRSNWGRYIDILAPGGSPDKSPPEAEPRRSILSLKAESFSNTEKGKRLVVGERYVRLSGTSMAAPHVAGVAALVLAVRADLTNEDVMRIITASATDIPSPGFDLFTGYGRLNASSALALAVHKPPTVRLTEPCENFELPQTGGAVKICGLASGERLRDFQLFYSRLDQLDELKPVTESKGKPVEGEFCTWETSDLPAGCYLLRLVVTDSDGNRFEDMVQVHKSHPNVVHLNDPAEALFAATSGRRIAWVETYANVEDAGFRVVVLDRKTHKKVVIAETSLDPSPIAISDDYVAYHVIESADDTSALLKLHELTTGNVETVSKEEFKSTTLQLSGRRLVWEGNSAVMMYEIDSGRVCKVSGRLTAREPHFDGDRVVWTTEYNNVALCDLRTGQVRLLTEDGHLRSKGSPRISKDSIIWQETDAKNPDGRYDIVLFNLEQDRTRILKGGVYLIQGPEISGDKIVWSDARNGNHDVYLFDLSSHEERSLTTSPDLEGLPSIGGQTVIWRRYVRVVNGPEGRYIPEIELYDLVASAAHDATGEGTKGALRKSSEKTR